MTGPEAPSGTPTGAAPRTSWIWATLIAIHPSLTTAALVGLLLFGLTSAVTPSLRLPDFLPLLPGVPALIATGIAYVYTPIYLTGLILDLRQVRSAEIAWNPSWWMLLAGSVQVVYFIVPIVQAYEGDTFGELVFGSVELAALLAAGLATVRYLNTRDGRFPGAPRLVSLWSSVWSKAVRR